jgi:hypothetical protein
VEVCGEWHHGPSWTKRPMGGLKLGQLQVRKEKKQICWTGSEKGCYGQVGQRLVGLCDIKSGKRKK